ncbi:Carbamoyl-phosphate synthase large chain [Wickerhamomyces ciferrii]|uniref:Ammonium-dependent carbamoyl phosphate synthetase n=1 Tax=Wickerhamomyces ciferrii (strain ATCC 14091 / BCRC 22168 / CBS 111 / JCM 3599 / NBRC 0793 / NRRL Y-1031 F-60-10) TaxID=1206466 RepID=K0L057_WICCF|nr:Carbamoyl-phosphate synthase large chain [Wickerhamomyces ciferrii]CCH46999.1 Carbamoyl-phosphate synthase large chain [Wickerhamomyces ciferrii]
MDVYELDGSKGVTVSVGAQLPQNFSLIVQNNGVQEQFAENVGFQDLAPPSYAQSGAAMSVIRNEGELEHKLDNAPKVSPDHTVIISKFIKAAQTIDFDTAAAAANGKLLVLDILEHVENAGIIHSGDATLLSNLLQDIFFWKRI